MLDEVKKPAPFNYELIILFTILIDHLLQSFSCEIEVWSFMAFADGRMQRTLPRITEA